MSHLNRRSFNALSIAALGVGIALEGCQVPLAFSCEPWDVKVPEAEQVVPEIAAGYAVKLFTRQHKIIDSVIQHVEPVWGKLGFLGVTNFHSCESDIAGCCILRPNGEIISSYRFSSNICVCNGDTIKASITIKWVEHATVEQILEASSRAPRGRTIRHGFEPSLLVGKQPSFIRDDIARLFPERVA